MGSPSEPASNAIIYLSFGFVLALGLLISWRFSEVSNFLSGNRTQRALPLACNFVASAMGCGVLTTYPEISSFAGVQGLLVYALSSASPIMLFAILGPTIRRHTPEGFVLTEWTRERFGIVTGLYLSFFTVATMFLYMVGELTSLQTAIETLTGMDALPAMIVEAVVTTIYTSWGGFRTSFITDNIQGTMIAVLLVFCSIAMGTQIHVDTSKIKSSGLLNANLLGWQLLYILPVAIGTNDCFLSAFWLRAFASRTDKDLVIGCAIASVFILVFLTVVGVTGLIANWGGLLKPDLSDGYMSFFYVLLQLPAWVVGFVLFFVILLSTAAFDSLQSAMVSTISNDIFRNKLKTIWVRLIVVAVMVPSIVVALQAPNVLTIFLISDLISAAVVPSLLLGLWSKMYFLTGIEIIASGLGGILSVFIYGTIYYGSAKKGAQLIILTEGLYAADWGAFGAFVAAPIGGLIFGFITLIIRVTIQYINSRVKGTPFTAFDKARKERLFKTKKSKLDEDSLIDEGQSHDVEYGLGATSRKDLINNKSIIGGEESPEEVETVMTTFGEHRKSYKDFFDFDESAKIKSIFFVPNNQKIK